MPISKPVVAASTVSPLVNEMLSSFSEMNAHPFDDIRKMQYRSNAEGWYMDGHDFAIRFGRNFLPGKSAVVWARNALIENGIGTDQFSISEVLRCPETNLPTVWVFKIDKSLPNMLTH